MERSHTCHNFNILGQVDRLSIKDLSLKDNNNSIENYNYFNKYIRTNNPIIKYITTSSNKVASTESKKRVKDILLFIIKKEKEKLKKVCFEGLPDEVPHLRSLIWKINLRYLSLEIEKWSIFLKKKHSEYEDIKNAFTLKMQAERELFQELNEYSIEISNGVNLNTQRQQNYSDLNKFIKFTDKELLEEIDKDVRRTHTDLNFFFMPSQPEDMKYVTNKVIQEIVEKRRSNDVKTIDDIYFNKNSNQYETHADVLCRILYIYAKLNPDIVYVQGMNEILASIYYCFSFDAKIPDNNLEADAFWSFTYLMDDIKYIFMREKDNGREGIFKKIEILSQIIKIVDSEIYNHFLKHSVELAHFAFRWIILLFTQEFSLPDSIRLWDTILSDKDRFYYVFLICLAIIKIKKKNILLADFAGTILILQNIEDLNINMLLLEVTKIKKGFSNKIKKILENSYKLK